MTETPPGQQNPSESPDVSAEESIIGQNLGDPGTTAPDPLIGTNLGGRYDVLSAIASGGMGVVYRGRHILMDKIVAIKVLNAVYANEPGALARFQHEAKVACQLSHPNIVVVHDFGMTDEKMLYLVMDFVEGQTLGQILDDQANLPVERVIEIALQLCDGLQYAHDQGLIHRDLKPSNIMIVQTKDGLGQVKILDFGLAKFMVDGKQQALSQTGYVLGSGYYMSPEQCRGKPADVRSEIYAVGCVLYEALIGLPPLVGDNLLETCQKHIEETPIEMTIVRPDLDIPAALESVVKRALEKDPLARFQSVAELREALEAAREKLHCAVPLASTAAEQLAGATGGDQVPAKLATPSVVTTPAHSFRSIVTLLGIVAIGSATAFYYTSSKSWHSAGLHGPTIPAAAPLSQEAALSTSTASIPATGSTTDAKTASKASSTAISVASLVTAKPTAVPVSPPPIESKAWSKYYREAGIAVAQEHYGPAEKLLQRAVAEARRSGNKAELLLALRKLEDVLYFQQKFKEADGLDPEVHQLAAAAAAAPAEQLALKSASSIDKSAAIANPSESQDDRIAHIAMSCHKRGQCDTAVSLLEHSVAIAKRMYGPRSLKTATRISELASLYMALDEPAKAQPLLDEVMEIKAAKQKEQGK